MSLPIYTEEDLQAAIRVKVREALERAAQECVAMYDPDAEPSDDMQNCADAIRAILKEYE